MTKLSKEKKFEFQDMYILFVIFSFVGVVYEEILAIVKYFHKFHIFLWRSRRGVIYGPFNPLYGAAIVFIIMILGRKKRPIYKTFLYGAFLGGFIEYLISFLMELVLKVKSWDYANRLLNINGRTTIPYMVFWGFAIAVLIHYVYPFLKKLLAKIPPKFKRNLVIFLVIFMTLNMVISWTALARQTLRHKGYEPLTIVGELYDKIYPDEVLKKTYNNMKFMK